MSKERLIFALDVENAEEARALIAELGDDVGSLKIGLQLFTSEGPSFVKNIVENGHRVFLDVKFHDIPNTVAAAAVEVARLGVWMFNVHISGGSKMLRLTVSEVDRFCRENGLNRPKIIGVTVLTSSDAEILEESGIRLDPQELAVRRAITADKCGLDGVVASPLEAGAIREAVSRNDFLIVTPGVRPSFATIDDQRRVTTPGEAIRNGADYLVVGRPIKNAGDRRAAVRKILEELSPSK